VIVREVDAVHQDVVLEELKAAYPVQPDLHSIGLRLLVEDSGRIAPRPAPNASDSSRLFVISMMGDYNATSTHAIGVDLGKSQQRLVAMEAAVHESSGVASAPVVIAPLLGVGRGIVAVKSVYSSIGYEQGGGPLLHPFNADALELDGRI